MCCVLFKIVLYPETRRPVSKKTEHRDGAHAGDERGSSRRQQRGTGMYPVLIPVIPVE